MGNRLLDPVTKNITAVRSLWVQGKTEKMEL